MSFDIKIIKQDWLLMLIIKEMLTGLQNADRITSLFLNTHFLI